MCRSAAEPGSDGTAEPGVTSDELTLLAGPATGGGALPALEPLAGPLLDPSRFPDPMPGALPRRSRALDPLAGPLADGTRLPDPMPVVAYDRGRRPPHENDVDSPADSGARQEAGRRAGARAVEIRRPPDATTLAPLSVPVVTPSRPAAAPATLASFWAFGG